MIGFAKVKGELHWVDRSKDRYFDAGIKTFTNKTLGRDMH
jgi:hypothetical protein